MTHTRASAGEDATRDRQVRAAPAASQPDAGLWPGDPRSGRRRTEQAFQRARARVRPRQRHTWRPDVDTLGGRHSTREPARPRRAAAQTGRGGVTWSDRQGACGSRHSTQSRTQRKGPEEKAARLEESPLRGAGSARAGRRRGPCRGQEPEAGGTGATRGLGARPRESP